MKKHAFTLLKIATIFAFLSATTSCSDIEDTKSYDDSKTASIEIQIGSAARTITPSYKYFDQMAKIVFSGKQTDGNATYEKTWNGEQTPSVSGDTYWTSAYTKLQEDPSVKDIPFGNWAFSLECYDKDGALICFGKTKKTLKQGNNGAIVIELENVKGKGSIEIELNISEQKIKDAFVTLENNYNIATSNYMGEVVNNEGTAASSQDSGYGIKACLKNLDGTVVIESGILPLKIPKAPTALAYSVRYEEEEIPAGSYILSFMVYEKKDAATAESLLTTVSELVNVAPGITTNGSLVLTSLNKNYPINYARYVYTYVTDEEYTEKGEFDASWLTGNIPLTYTEYDTITLPTAIDVLRPCDEELYYDYDTTYYTCYAFNGWYLDEDLEHPIEKIIGSEQSGEINLYASFKELRLRYSATTAVGVKDPGKLTVDFETNATLSKEWLEKIEWSLDRDAIIQIDNLKPKVFHEPHEYEYNGETYTYYVNYVSFENAKALKFGKAILSAKINDILIGACEIEFSDVFTQEVANAFYPDKTITTMEVPDIYTSAADYAFSDSWPLDGYPNLEKVILPDTFTSIDRFAFANCGKLKDVNIPNGVTYIGEYAFGTNYDDGADVFYRCKFETIKIPASVESIGESAFLNCDRLKTVIVEAETPPTLGGGVFDGTQLCKGKIYVPASSVSAYQSADGWSDFKDIIEEIQNFSLLEVELATESDYNVELKLSNNSVANPTINVEVKSTLPAGVSVEKIVLDGEKTYNTTEIAATELSAGTHSILVMFTDGKSSHLTFTLKY